MSVKKVWYAPYMKQAYGEEEMKAVADCLNDGWLSPGPRTAEFEEKIAARFGKKYGLFVNSGSSANMLAVICAGVTKGVEVVTPACTFSTTVAPLVQNGATVRFCDVAPNRYVPTVEQVLEQVTPNTKVIMIPNLLGNKINWKELKAKLVEMKREDIVLIEDSCDTITHTPETDIATVSFYASHIITAGGTGGMVMFNNKDWHHRALQIRDWGRVGNNSEAFEERFNNTLPGGIQYDWKFFYCEFGYNFKACEMNAAFGLAQLEKLPRFEELRMRLLDRYISNLKADPVAAKYYKFPEFEGRILWLACPLACDDRIELLKYLEDNQVQTRVTMAGNILRHPIYANAFPEEAKKSFPVSDQVMKEGFLVGCHHGMTEEDVDRVSNLLIEFAKAHSK
ncbi:DegT/DnrJ/EryC1/StrS aminotransferase family protein [Histomonas meleagridis]|uniref:DegT/DnrJ/EryC1/StrS aminotransferase family protein n=1 Tax=Histomonas meleagridis TaxID=135588 RepID=UPI00355A5151|nr:DegT/DnrJ/EryC1/StrS aminotransferase family protein [Histomonas meleagridis]KAH0798595.1 DegT/DnrJ/EryC1/StrS aminotransferase family protein [Histomonas meleagridis]